VTIFRLIGGGAWITALIIGTTTGAGAAIRVFGADGTDNVGTATGTRTGLIGISAGICRTVGVLIADSALVRLLSGFASAGAVAGFVSSSSENSQSKPKPIAAPINSGGAAVKPSASLRQSVKITEKAGNPLISNMKSDFRWNLADFFKFRQFPA
jgi:hypothetical protein